MTPTRRFLSIDVCLQLLPALLLIAGSLVFLGAGRHHPIVSAATVGPLGTDQYFRAFAGKMLSMHNWESVHLGILLGPVLWALGTAGIARGVSGRARGLADIGKTALLLGAGLWAIAFVLDGYAGPRLAQSIALAGVDNDAAAIRSFSTNQYTMARLGMLSVVLIGCSMIALAFTTLTEMGARNWRGVVAGLGLGVGVWILSMAIRGEFSPGPFTSERWTLLAISLGVWFLLFGLAKATLSRPERRDRIDPRGTEGTYGDVAEPAAIGAGLPNATPSAPARPVAERGRPAHPRARAR